jgi:hypothetical protein
MSATRSEQGPVTVPPTRPQSTRTTWWLGMDLTTLLTRRIGLHHIDGYSLCYVAARLSTCMSSCTSNLFDDWFFHTRTFATSAPISAFTFIAKEFHVSVEVSNLISKSTKLTATLLWLNWLWRISIPFPCWLHCWLDILSPSRIHTLMPIILESQVLSSGAPAPNC